jgi:uncharacterized protein YukE
MSIETAIVCGILILVSLYLVIAPFRSKSTISPAVLAFQRQRDALLVYYEQVTSSLRDLQEDSAAGKISPEEYQVEYEKWMQRGVQILQVLEELDRENQPLISNGNKPVEDVDQAIEDAVQRYLKSNKAVSAAKE